MSSEIRDRKRVTLPCPERLYLPFLALRASTEIVLYGVNRDCSRVQAARATEGFETGTVISISPETPGPGVRLDEDALDTLVAVCT